VLNQSEQGLYTLKMVSMSEILIAVPDAFGDVPDAVERLFAILHTSSTSDPIALDLTEVTWIRP
jgi:hypothetical protein